MELSVVVPVYACAPCIQELVERLEIVIPQLGISLFEIILVDDFSPDNAWAKIKELKNRFSRVKGIRFTRNFGQHYAISAGLAEACGNWVFVMDCDLQDPPESFPLLWSKKDEGFDVIFAARKKRTHTLMRRLLASFHARVLSFVTGKKIEPSHGTFSLISRRVVEKFNLFTERKRHYSYIVKWLGFPMTEVEIQQNPRLHGRSSYNFLKLLQHSTDGFLFQAQDMLRVIVYLGFLFNLMGFVLAGYFIYRYIINTALPGWTSLVVLLLVCSGLISISVGFVGIYVGEIFDQLKNRPLYVIDEKT